MKANRSTAAITRYLRAGILALVAATSLGACGMFADADSRVEKAERLITQRDYRGAMIELKNANDSEPQHARARLTQAEGSLLLGATATAAN